MPIVTFSSFTDGLDRDQRSRDHFITDTNLENDRLWVARRIVNPHVLRCFLRPSLTEAPSLCRSYPASSVLRTSPPPHTARPVSRELPVDPYCESPLGLPVLRLVSYAYMPSPLPRQIEWSLFARLSPSPAAFPV